MTIDFDAVYHRLSVGRVVLYTYNISGTDVEFTVEAADLWLRQTWAKSEDGMLFSIKPDKAYALTGPGSAESASKLGSCCSSF